MEILSDIVRIWEFGRRYNHYHCVLCCISCMHYSCFTF